MAKIFGSVVGALLTMLLGGVVLLASQDPSCTEDWWKCSPGGPLARAVQGIGLVIFLIGPFVGLRLGAWLAPKITLPAGIGIGVGALPGLATAVVGWWVPISAALVVIGALAGGLIGARRSQERQPEAVGR